MTQWEYCSLQYHDDGTLMYYFYGQKGLEDYAIYQGANLEKAEDFTSKYVFTLGALGWEAINVVRRNDGIEYWYFKRRVLPSNQYLPL